ncbi:hypothetical protein [Microbacterium sp. PMB16]|uniref:hypothetical protein n=1 Tax=Microbacterium sp. PMB16 TaxID=3120157 RepID=UPI003F4B9A56
MNFEALLAVAASLAAVAALAVTITRSSLAAVAAKKQLDRLKQVRVNDVLAEPSVASLGGLLVDDLGQTTLPSYARDPEVRREFRRAFNAIRAFVGTNDSDADDRGPLLSEPEPEPESNAPTIGWIQPATASGRAAIRDLNAGETWNALARMRREVETTVAGLLPGGSDERPRVGAGRLIALASKQGVLPAHIAANLRYPISIANAAVHGEDVSPDNALEAIRIMDKVLNEIAHLKHPE